MATSTAQAIATVPVWDYQMASGDPLNPNPKGLSGKRVKVTLSYAQAQSASPVTLLGTDPVVTQTDINGFWQVNLVPNNKISPSGTIYTVEIEGYRSYVIQVTDVNAPAIGWQSSAIATLPPVGGGAPGYTLPGGTTILGNLTINGSIVVQGGNEHYDVSHAVYAGGALGNGANDDAAAINAASLAASNAGGGEVWLPPTPTNVYGIKSSLNIYANVAFSCVPGTIIRWIAGSQSVATYMMGNIATVGVHFLHVAMYNITLDGASAAKVSGLRLDSIWWGWFENLDFLNCNGGNHGDATYALQMLASVGTTFANNTTGCTFTNLRIDSCRRGIQFNANQNGVGSTNNFFVGVSMICSDAWIDFQQWCDSNYIDDWIFGAAFDSNSTFTGVTCGSNVSDLGVHSERFQNGSMDFNTSGMPGAIGIVLNICASIFFEKMFSGIGNVAGVTTFENGTLFQNNNCNSGRIEWINQALATGQNRTYIFELSTGTGNRRFLTNATDVNGITTAGAATGNPPSVAAIGTDTNVDIAVSGQGTGVVRFTTNRANQIWAIGGATGQAVQFQVQGVDSNIPIHIAAKGTAEVRIGTQQTDFLAIFGNPSGNPSIAAQGGDANINILIVPKGNGVTGIGSNLANFINISGSGTGSGPYVAAGGADTNMDLRLAGQGAGGIELGFNTTNHLQAIGAATGLGATLKALGGDANIDLILASKGTGMVNAGVAGARLRVDSFGHLISDSTGTPATSNLGANVTSVTPTGNDIRGKLVIVMSGALAANTRICTVTFANAYAAIPGYVGLTNETSGAGLGIVDFYTANKAAASFDLLADQALAAGTYECEYLVVG